MSTLRALFLSLAATAAIALGFIGLRAATIDRAADQITITVNPLPGPYVPTSVLDPNQVNDQEATADTAIATAIANGVPPCPTDEIPEDGSPCYWDARVRGNHKGRSYVAQDGRITWEQ